MLTGKQIILGVCGGIAAYKAVSLTSKLVKAGAQVHVIMTASAQKFVTPLTFQAISKQHVYLDTFDEFNPSVISHISLADQADLILIVPATANILAKLAYGLADDMLTTTVLASRAPIYLAPAMNGHMYENPIVQTNKKILLDRGMFFIEPEIGLLACGYEGKGRLAEPEEIFETIKQHDAQTKSLSNSTWTNRKILVTAGGTIEKIDPVRYIGNHSSGKMGYQIAIQARNRGAQVTLITTPTFLPKPGGIEIIQVESAQEMYDSVFSHYEQNEIICMTAAVADYRPKMQAEHKIKKNENQLTIEFVRNPDILQEMGIRKKHQFLVGFAAETENLEMYALEKLKRKRCDLLVANNISEQGAGFGIDTNKVSIFDENGLIENWPILPKEQVANKILDLVSTRYFSHKASVSEPGEFS